MRQMPEDDAHLNQQDYDKLFKHCVNSASYYVNEFSYSSQRIREVFKYKKRVPQRVFVEGEPVNLTEEVLSYLEQSGILDDGRILTSLVRSRLNRKKSIRQIRDELRIKHKFPSSQIDQTLSAVLEDKGLTEYDADYESAYRDITAAVNSGRVFASFDLDKTLDKASAKLIRKGFSVSAVKAAVSEVRADVLG